MTKHLVRTCVLSVAALAMPGLAVAQTNNSTGVPAASPQEKTENSAPAVGGADRPEAATKPQIRPNSPADKQEQSGAATGSATGSAGTSTSQPVPPRNPADKQVGKQQQQ